MKTLPNYKKIYLIGSNTPVSKIAKKAKSVHPIASASVPPSARVSTRQVFKKTLSLIVLKKYIPYVGDSSGMIKDCLNCNKLCILYTSQSYKTECNF